MDHLRGRPFWQGLKARTIDLLELAEGAHALDVGCGTGEDVQALARAVGPSGRAVGVDRSATMVAEAQTRAAAAGARAEFLQGDAHALEFPDASFDGCRAERVLQHLRDPRGAVAELARVARPGAWIVAAEPDHETSVVDVPDRGLTRRLINYRGDQIRNPWMGRQLPRLFREAGLREVEVFPMTLTHVDDFSRVAPDAWPNKLVDAAVAAGAATREEGDRWLALVEETSRAGGLFSALTIFVARGRGPQPAAASSAMVARSVALGETTLTGY